MHQVLTSMEPVEVIHVQIFDRDSVGGIRLLALRYGSYGRCFLCYIWSLSCGGEL